MTSLLPPCPPEALTFRWLAESVFFPLFQLFLLLSAGSFLACLPSPPRVPNGNSDCLYPSPLNCEPYVDRELVNPFLTTVFPAPSSVRHCRLPLNERMKAQETLSKSPQESLSLQPLPRTTRWRKPLTASQLRSSSPWIWTVLENWHY